MNRWIAPTVWMLGLCSLLGLYGWRTGMPALWLFAVWPPAGVALAGVMVWGRRAVPGIVLGITLCYVTQTTPRPQDAAGVVNLIASSVLLAVIAAVQALAGAACVRWFAQGDEGLIRVRAILLFAMIAGPSQAIVSTLLGPPVRIAFGQRDALDYGHFMLDWWMNEITGGIAFSIIVLAFFAEPKFAWRPRRSMVALPLLAAVLLMSLYDEYGPADLVALPKFARRGLEAFGTVSLTFFAILLLVITGQSAAVQQEVLRMTESLTDEAQARLEAQVSLAKSELLLTEAQHIARIGSWTWDPAGFVAEWSDQMYRLLGYEPKAFVPTFDAFLACVHPDDREMVRARMVAAENGDAYSYDFRIIKPDGTVRILHAEAIIDRDAAGRPQRWRGTDQDVTERVQAEQEARLLDDRLRTMHRWESLGQLAGGVAHDFNNLMGGVLGYATLAREQLPADAPTQEFLKPIQDAALHASSLCQQLLIFAGKGTSARGTIDLAELVQSTTDLVRMSVPKLIELRIQLEEGLPPIEGDASQLKQVLLNLVWNAADAISTEGGVIEVRTGAGHRSCAVTGRGHECTTLPGSDYAWFEVRDTGCGIADAALERIFEPFYSTKDQGRGLGLSAVAGIVRSHGGGLCVTSRVGAGTTIRAYLIANATGTNRMTRSESQTAPAIPHLETQAREMYAMSGGLA